LFFFWEVAPGEAEALCARLCVCQPPRASCVLSSDADAQSYGSVHQLKVLCMPEEHGKCRVELLPAGALLRAAGLPPDAWQATSVARLAGGNSLSPGLLNVGPQRALASAGKMLVGGPRTCYPHIPTCWCCCPHQAAVAAEQQSN
jgi:hypothetical protein